MHQLDIYITEHTNFNLNHTIHANIPNTHTLTSTSHHQSDNDLLYPLVLIVTSCPQIAYNQVMQWPQLYTNSCISLSLMDNYINMHIITKQHTPISICGNQMPLKGIWPDSRLNELSIESKNTKFGVLMKELCKL